MSGATNAQVPPSLNYTNNTANETFFFKTLPPSSGFTLTRGDDSLDTDGIQCS